MSMRKIYQALGKDVSEAWIGVTAPVPNGWHLDVNSAMEAKDGLRKEAPKKGRHEEEVRAHNEDGTFKADDPATPEVNEAYEPPKKRGRPKSK